MKLSPVDWAVVLGYVIFALAVGLRFAKRAGQDVEEFFLSGRKLPWWIAGTSMIATSFAADTPLVVSAWVRDHGLWKNWLWWCYALGSLLTVFLFARYWRRGQVMTTAELAELRYGGRGARVLRSFLGVYHSAITNTIVLCWVLLAAAKIMDVLFGVDKLTALVAASTIALAYASLAGFWGVVVTDLLQFVMAAVGATWLAVRAWDEIGGGAGLAEALSNGVVTEDTLSFFPSAGGASPFEASFWSTNVTTVAVYLGVAWWTVESVDGGSHVVQRISACRDELHGRLAVLWYSFVHFALRPWPWIVVAVASLVLLPSAEVRAPVAGVVTEVSASTIRIESSKHADDTVTVPLNGAPDWKPAPRVEVGTEVQADAVIARTDSERAYVVMMARYLPAGVLGLVVASLLAAFMSTIDTHVNLASSFFVNDVYRRFLVPKRAAKHYVTAARLASVVVLALASTLAWHAESISQLFTFFLAFLGGVGPVYILRWLWWRVRASTEIAAMLTSSLTTVGATFFFDKGWPDCALAPQGVLSAEGRLCLVAVSSSTMALLSMLVTRAPDPRDLIAFYEQVRPRGFWGPVRRLCAETETRSSSALTWLGILGGAAAIYGTLVATGSAVFGRTEMAAVALLPAGLGLGLVVLALRGSGSAGSAHRQ